MIRARLLSLRPYSCGRRLRKPAPLLCAQYRDSDINHAIELAFVLRRTASCESKLRFGRREPRRIPVGLERHNSLVYFQKVGGDKNVAFVVLRMKIGIQILA